MLQVNTNWRTLVTEFSLPFEYVVELRNCKTGNLGIAIGISRAYSRRRNSKLSTHLSGYSARQFKGLLDY